MGRRFRAQKSRSRESWAILNLVSFKISIECMLNTLIQVNRTITCTPRYKVIMNRKLQLDLHIEPAITTATSILIIPSSSHCSPTLNPDLLPSSISPGIEVDFPHLTHWNR